MNLLQLCSHLRSSVCTPVQHNGFGNVCAIVAYMFTTTNSSRNIAAQVVMGLYYTRMTHGPQRVTSMLLCALLLLMLQPPLPLPARKQQHQHQRE